MKEQIYIYRRIIAMFLIALAMFGAGYQWGYRIGSRDGAEQRQKELMKYIEKRLKKDENLTSYFDTKCPDSIMINGPLFKKKASKCLNTPHSKAKKLQQKDIFLIRFEASQGTPF